jgi:hypothetical protein
MNVNVQPLKFIEETALHNYEQLGSSLPLHVMCEGVLVGVVYADVFIPTVTTTTVFAAD